MLLLLAVIGVVVLATPAAAVSAGDSASKAGTGGYTVTFVKSSGSIQPMKVYNSISQGQYQWAGKNINYYTTSLPFDLYWGNPSNSLRLRIFTPDGYVLGPYYDSIDGLYNGEINMYVNRAGGVAQGTWAMEIYGYSVSGSQNYWIE